MFMITPGYKKAKILFLLLIGILYVINPVLILIFIPGTLFFTGTEKLNLLEKISYSIGVSVSYWITTFWFLKFIPIRLSDFITLSVIISLVIVLIKHDWTFTLNLVKKSELVSVFLAVLLLSTVIPWTFVRVSPPGADMSTHAYIANLIRLKNSFPKTYEPIAPSDKFSSSYIGLSILIAEINTFANIPMNNATLLISVFSFLMIILSLFTFLQQKFGKVTSFISTIVVVWVGRDITHYYLWGGNPTILSCSLLFWAVSYYYFAINSAEFSFKNSLILSLFISASFLTHPTPITVFAYFLIFFMLINYKSIKAVSVKHLRFYLLILIFSAILILPFMSSINLPNAMVFENIKNLQRNSDISWNGNFLDFFYTVPLYIRDRTGYLFFFLGSLGILLSPIVKKRERVLFLCFTLTEMFLIINTRYWFLPLSSLLFPDRIATVNVISFAFFIGVVVDLLISYLKNVSFRSKIEAGLVMLAMLFISIFLISDVIASMKYVYRNITEQTSVTQDDINVFNWITLNTTENQVIVNNYGDSGIWIPAYATRKITSYDATLFELDKFQTEIKKYQPDLLYIGSKTVYPNSIKYKYEDLKQNSNYLEIFHSGGAHLFKIIKK